MANVNTKAHVLVRDGFVCQFCGKMLFLSQAVHVLDRTVPGLDLWDRHGKKEPLRSRWATVDHLIPEIDGGMDVLDNLVACCVTCNSRKGGTQANAPDLRRTVAGWDGLTSIFLGLAPQYAERIKGDDQKWWRALEREGTVARTDHMAAVVECLLRAKTSGTLDGLDAALSVIHSPAPNA